MIGHCGGLRPSQTIGDYVLAHAYLRDDHVMDDVLPTEVPIPAIAEIQQALFDAAIEVTGEEPQELKRRLRTGTVVTTDDRNWELRFTLSALRFNQSRAVADRHGIGDRRRPGLSLPRPLRHPALRLRQAAARRDQAARPGQCLLRAGDQPAPANRHRDAAHPEARGRRSSIRASSAPSTSRRSARPAPDTVKTADFRHFRPRTLQHSRNAFHRFFAGHGEESLNRKNRACYSREHRKARSASGESVIMKKIALLCATTAFVMPGMAFAQSTGTDRDVEEEANVVVTGTRTARRRTASPFRTRAKAQAVLELGVHPAPDAGPVDQLRPSTSFRASTSPTTIRFGSSGGNLRIRGFDGNRISLTFDGIPLNDIGNYAHLLEPAARSGADRAGQRQPRPDRRRQPDRLGDRRHRQLSAPACPIRDLRRPRLPARRRRRHYRRGFGCVDSGEWWENGPRAFVASRTARNDPFRGPRRDLQAAVQRPHLPSDRQQRRLHLDRRPLQPEPQQFLPQPGVQRPAHRRLSPTADRILAPRVVRGRPRADRSRAGRRIMTPSGTRSAASTISTPARSPRSRAMPASPRTTMAAPLPNGTGAQRDRRRQQHPERVELQQLRRRQDQPVQHRQHPHHSRFTLRQPDPDGRSELPICAGQWRRHDRRSRKTDVRVRGGARSAAGLSAGQCDFNGDGDILDTVRFYTPNNTNTQPPAA